MDEADHLTLVSLSGEIQTKSRGTRRAFRSTLRANLRAALVRQGVDARVIDRDGRLMVHGAPDAAARTAMDVFGVHRALVVRPLGTTVLEEVTEAVVRHATGRVRDRTFAVRVRRRGALPWRRSEAERQIGAALLDASAGVDLERPEETVRLFAYDDDVFLVERELDGPGGLPVGTQDPALVLLSGGFDSAAAAWYVLRRGAPVHFVHFELACAQTDHALAVARELTSRWAAGTEPVVWVVDFSEVRAALLDDVASRVRQVRLKELMVAAADRIAEREGFDVLVTGDAIGQVSTQTMRNLAVINAATTRPVLRPLAGFDKNEIVALTRRIGTHDLSVRAQEGCDLSDGPVATAPRDAELAPARDAAPDTLALEAAERSWRLPVATWTPGLPAPWAA